MVIMKIIHNNPPDYRPTNSTLKQCDTLITVMVTGKITHMSVGPVSLQVRTHECLLHPCESPPMHPPHASARVRTASMKNEEESD